MQTPDTSAVPADPTALPDARIEGYELLGYQAAVGASTPEALEAIRYILRGFGPVDVGPGLQLPRYELLHAQDAWTLRINQTVIQQDPDLSTALSTLEWYVVTDALGQRKETFQLHGAALCLPTTREGIILSGESGSGKTTLTLGLMLRGFAPFSDDVVLMTPATRELHPMRRAFHVSDDSRAVVTAFADGRIAWDAAAPSGYYLPPQWATVPVPAKWVLFVEYREGQEPQLIPVAPSDAARTILGRSPSLVREPRMTLSTTARLLEHASVYRCLAGDLRATVAMVQDLVSRPAAL